MAATTLNSKGLLQPAQDDPNQTSLGNLANPSQTGNATGVTSPFAGQTPALAGGAVGVQQNYTAPAVKQYAFNPYYASQDQALQRAIANYSLDRSNQLSGLDQGYQQQTSEAARQEDLARSALAQRMSSQGIGFSGINAGAQGDLEGDYNRYVGSLGQQYAGGKATIENQYARQLGDIASQREQLYQTQAKEEAAAKQQAAKDAADAAARQQQAQMQMALQQQMIAQQQAALSQPQPSYGGGQGAYANGIGAGSGAGVNFGGVTGGNSYADILGLINSQTNRDWLNAFDRVPGMPDPIRQAIAGRLGTLLHDPTQYDNQVKMKGNAR